MGAILSNLGGLLHNTGRLAEALIVLEESSTRLARAGNRQQAMQFAYNQAVILGELGQLTAKRRLLESTHTEAVAGGAHDLVAAISVALGNLHLLQDDLDGAQRWFAAVPPDHPAQGAWAALGLGRVAVERESYAEAAQQFDRVQRSETGAIVQVMAATRRAELELRRGAAASALTMLEPLLSSAEQGLNVAWMVPTLYGKALLATGRPESEAVPHFRAAVAAVESRGAGLDPTGAGMTYLRERSEPFAELSWTLAVDPASAASVLQVVEQAHARSLRQLLREEGRAPPPFTGLTALQRRLAPGDLLLDYLIGEERGVLVAVTADVARVVRLPGWSTLREPLQRYRAALRRPLTSAEARLDPSRDLLRDLAQGHTLRQALLGPVEALVRAADRLLVVPDQDLALLPLAALPSVEPLRFLGDEVAIALLPMAGAPVALRDAAGPLLLAGDPLSDAQGEFPVLPLAGRELDEVEAIWLGHEVTRLRRGDLRAERLRRLDLAAFRALHFATHAEASSSDPQRCAVILSEGERLGMHEIAALQLSPSLVILSACRTGEGEVIPGEGVVGLSWAFLRAGAGGVVASLWNVEDAATTALMVELHRELRRGSEPARALREAQRSARVGQRHPAYWAGFVVMLGPAA
jgi:CHAT domain-containing protein